MKFCQRLAPIKNDLTANMRTANPDGPEVEIINYLGNEDEAENVLAHIQTLPGKSAVLARTNSQIGLFETLATAQEIKFHLLGKSGFWKTPEIRNLMGLVHFVLGNDPAESYPQRMVLPQRNAIRSLPATEALNRVITAANLKELYADEDYEEKDNFALDNLNGATRIAQRFPNLGEFAAFAIRASKASRKSKSAISFGTVHAAKGLEFENVFIIGFQEGKIPHEKGDIFEEKCIAYVAVSRAARVLQLSYSGQRSRFLSELDIEGVQV